MVAVGLTLVDPLADVDVNVPGVMTILVVPVTDQLRVVLAPELMVVGLAVKEVIAGAEPVPEEELSEIIEPQPARLTQTSGRRSIAQRWRQEKRGFRELRPFLRNELGEFMGPLFGAVNDTVPASAAGSFSS